MQWTAADVVGILGTRSVVAGISTDTRTLRPGEVFLALAGGSFDGHDYVEEAFAAGAVAAIVERWSGHGGGPMLVVDSTERALGLVASNYRQRFDLPVIGVVGSAGKTIEAHLHNRYRQIGVGSRAEATAFAVRKGLA